jgi:hypothetical protein
MTELQVPSSGGEHDTTVLVPLLVGGSSVSLCSLLSPYESSSTFYTPAHTKHSLSRSFL